MKFIAERPSSQWPVAPPQGELIRDESMIRGKASASPALSIARQGVIRPAQACSQKALSAN
jgi:hypothetical protein